MSRSMWFWFITNVEVKSGEFFMKKKASLIWVFCDTYKASKQLIVCSPRIAFKKCHASETIFHFFLLLAKVCVANIAIQDIWLQYFRQWSTWCMTIPKGSNQIKKKSAKEAAISCQCLFHSLVIRMFMWEVRVLVFISCRGGRRGNGL